ncbi:MAG: hypothetical protein U0T83_02895 [Bacteriovoracaceae bacterium]
MIKIIFLYLVLASCLFAEENRESHINDYQYRLKKNEILLNLSNNYIFTQLSFESESQTYLEKSENAIYLAGGVNYGINDKFTISVDEKYYYYQKISERYHGEHAKYNKLGVSESTLGIKHFINIKPELFYTVYFNITPKIARAKINNVQSGTENFQFGFIWDYFYKYFEVGGRLESSFYGPAKIEDKAKNKVLSAGKYSIFHFAVSVGHQFFDRFKFQIEHGVLLYTQREMATRLNTVLANKGYSFLMDMELLYALTPKLGMGLGGKFQTEIYNVKSGPNEREIKLEYQDFMGIIKLNYAFN